VLPCSQSTCREVDGLTLAAWVVVGVRYAAFLAVFSGVYVGADETLAGELQLPRISTPRRFVGSHGCGLLTTSTAVRTEA
jgi:hypothetical protein